MPTPEDTTGISFLNTGTLQEDRIIRKFTSLPSLKKDQSQYLMVTSCKFRSAQAQQIVKNVPEPTEHQKGKKMAYSENLKANLKVVLMAMK